MSQIDPLTTAPRSLRGQVFNITSPESLREALAISFDYRGDTTVVFNDGTQVDGYLYKFDDKIVSIFVKQEKTSVSQDFPVSKITSIVLSGEDPAWGKSWEDWAHKNAKQRAEEAERLRQQAEKEGYL